MGFKKVSGSVLLQRKTYNLTTRTKVEILKLQADRIEGSNAISRHSAEGVIVNGTAHTSSVIVPWQGAVEPWAPSDFAALSAEHFAQLAELKPELVIFGSGARLRFPSPALLRPLIDRRIGVETMDTAAASRTYNVLLAEGRAVVAALLFEPAAR
jgi:uncharacterized protein